MLARGISFRNSGGSCFAVSLLLFGATSFGQSQPVIDGDISDFETIVNQIQAMDLPAFGVNELDNIANGPSVGTDGFGDEPLDGSATPQGRIMHSPINVGNTFLIYKPDSDGDIGAGPGFAGDDSWLAVGVNIANGDGDVTAGSTKLTTPPDLPSHIMVPFDTDGDGDPAIIGTFAGSRFSPQEPVPGMGERNDAIGLFFKSCAFGPGDFQTGTPEVTIIYEQLFVGNTNLRVLLNGIDVGDVTTNFPMQVAPAG